MKAIQMALLAALAALVLAGCTGYGYGPHMGWGDRYDHMRGYPPASAPYGPCAQDPANPGAPGQPCPRAP